MLQLTTASFKMLLYLAAGAPQSLSASLQIYFPFIVCRIESEPNMRVTELLFLLLKMKRLE